MKKHRRYSDRLYSRGARSQAPIFYKEDKAIVEFMRQIKFLLILYLLGLMDFKSRRVIMHGLEVQTAHKILNK